MKKAFTMHSQQTRAGLASSVALAIFLVNACAIGHKPSSPTKDADEQDIFAAAIRTQMERCLGAIKKGESRSKVQDESKAKQLDFPIFFVSVDGKDPSDDFINRFRDIPRSIRKASSAIPAKGPHTPTDRTTGLTGVTFDVGDIRWLSGDTAEVKGGFHCGSLCGADFTFQVHRENGGWVAKISHTDGAS